jgi:hypothetical protein
MRHCDTVQIYGYQFMHNTTPRDCIILEPSLTMLGELQILLLLSALSPESVSGVYVNTLKQKTILDLT